MENVIKMSEDGNAEDTKLVTMKKQNKGTTKEEILGTNK